LADLARCVGQQTGITRLHEDWFPLACVTPFSKLTAAIRGTGVATISSHPHCSPGWLTDWPFVFVELSSAPRRGVSIR
jgi:uncharacterized radical SAM superfamily Fe-S cluster-containing enzyme